MSYYDSLPANQRPIVIVGAGVFGLSTAFHLLKRGYVDVTVLDRAKELPARDGAGYDMNKIVRSSYADPFYTEFAREAIAQWKTDEWKGCYHESGVFVLQPPSNHGYAAEAYENDLESGARLTEVRTPEQLQQVFPVPVGFAGNDSGPVKTEPAMKGYLNHDGGWVEAARALEIMLARVRELGGKVLGGKEVTGSITGSRKGVSEREYMTLRIVGVECADGTAYHGTTVILAAGAWTPRLLQRMCITPAPNVSPSDVEAQDPKGKRPARESEQQPSSKSPHDIVYAPHPSWRGSGQATGQVVTTLQLTPEEADRYRACPVVLDFGTGWYMFPPNDDNVVKMGIHSHGYLNQPSETIVSTPRTSLTDGKDGLRIPKQEVKKFRECLKEVYPELASKPFSGTRLCWYNDTPDDDWVIGPAGYPTNLYFATAGNGHAYKFLPNIGSLVADAIEDKLEPALKRRFDPHRKPRYHATSRVGPPPQPLKLEELCDEDDLKPETS